MAAEPLEVKAVHEVVEGEMEEEEEDTAAAATVDDSDLGNFAAVDSDVYAENIDEQNDSTEVNHISIQKDLSDLESLAPLDSAGKISCPLCPENKFKACYSHKLQRHIQNLHWKVSVELEGYRMCICYLPCQLMRANVNGDQSPVKLGSHYHCIICAAIIARRTDMVSHVKRHVNKGETEARFTGALASKALQESQKETDTDVWVLPNYTTPQKTDTFFNPRMKMNRQFIFCALAAFVEERKPAACLDAFGGTGIMGLQWAKHLGRLVKVTINDVSEKSFNMIQENCLLNKMKVIKQKEEDEEEGDDVTEEGEEFINAVEVTNLDANVLMHSRAFDFIHLDPFGTAVNYMDAAFRNVRNLGLISVTSTDIGTLYAKNLHVLQRNYGCSLIRTEYYREVGVRTVIGALARAAARSNKGIEVLLSVALEHFVLVVVRVLRGPPMADDCVKKIRRLIHCRWCEERIFQKEGNMLEENPYQQLPCTCYESITGKTAVELGPMWSGSIFNAGFLRRMLFESVQYGIDEIQTLLKTLICEAECTTQKMFCIQLCQNNQEESGVLIRRPDVAADYLSPSGKRKRPDMAKRSQKQGKFETTHPAFYYSIHRHSIRGMNIPKLNKFLQYLTETGFQVSRTHFDPTGVRTDATLQQIRSILQKYSTPCNTGLTGAQAGDCPQPTEDNTLDSPQPSEDPPAEEEAVNYDSM
ncbi:TRMT1-like protein [Rhinatrema bivittatum]|uniref:TRMT1-like protein n=1 Tax=Rhinatrema bivittatum TaxID=194408 RepID=UPI00112902A2|nr:TRMT1-like protein [Rhinatrema bivittatum]